MCSSLQHAQPVLAAASSSGFRESGLQSLRHLSEPSAHPIVAVRSSGLALESVIGYYAHEERAGGTEGGAGTVRSLVSEEYLRMLVGLGNQRFKVNSERMERFRVKLTESRSSSGKEGWEDADARRERKRAEGLARREAAHKTD
jgi:tRNA wybutosine-synthesizing protein 3